MLCKTNACLTDYILSVHNLLMMGDDLQVGYG